MPEDWSQTRWEQYREATDRLPQLPETIGGEYLLEALHEAGTYRTSDMGSPLPLLWQEVDAYARLTGSLDEPFEARTIMELSKAYVEGHSIGLMPNGIAPFDAWNPVASEWFK